MKKKIIISISIIVVIMITSAVVWAFSPVKNLKPSDYDDGITMQQVEKQNKPVLVLFYADWCTYCLKFMPKYKALKNVYKDEFNFVMLNIDVPENKKFIEDFYISFFPTVCIYDSAIDNKIFLPNAIYGDMALLKKEIDRYLRIRKMIKIEK
ncbi:MAG: thioredoxin domain-containing protein [bacterium]|nr:thioredoxin domain-containing protein [bacterium]